MSNWTRARWAVCGVAVLARSAHFSARKSARFWRASFQPSLNHDLRLRQLSSWLKCGNSGCDRSSWSREVSHVPEKIEEILCEFFAERLPGAGRPEGIVALAGAATKFGQRSVHSGFKAIGSLVRKVKQQRAAP